MYSRTDIATSFHTTVCALRSGVTRRCFLRIPHLVTLNFGPTQRFLNANWCQEKCGLKWWIASQAPLPETAYAFLSLIRERLTLPLSTPRTPRCACGQLFNSHNLSRVDGGKPTSTSPRVSGSVLSTSLSPDSRPHRSWCPFSTVCTSKRHAASSPPCPSQYRAATSLPSLSSTAWPGHGVPKPEEQQKLMAFMHLVERTNRQDSAPANDPDRVQRGRGAYRNLHRDVLSAARAWIPTHGPCLTAALIDIAAWPTAARI